MFDDNRRLHLLFDVVSRVHHIVFSRRDSGGRLLATGSTNSNEWTTRTNGYQGATTDGARTYWTTNTPAWLQVQQSWPRQAGDWTDFAHPSVRRAATQLFYPLMAPLPSGPSPDMLTAFAEQIGGAWPGIQLDWSDRTRRRLVQTELHRAPSGSNYTVRATPCDLEHDRGWWCASARLPVSRRKLALARAVELRPEEPCDRRRPDAPPNHLRLSDPAQSLRASVPAQCPKTADQPARDHVPCLRARNNKRYVKANGISTWVGHVTTERPGSGATMCRF